MYVDIYTVDCVHHNRENCQHNTGRRATVAVHRLNRLLMLIVPAHSCQVITHCMVDNMDNIDINTAVI